MMIWGTLMVQPSFALFGGKPAYGTCSKPEPKPASVKKKATEPGCKKKITVESGCSKKKCKGPAKPEKKNNCSTDGCNPTLGCSSGNFYIHQHFQISFATYFAVKQKAIVIDDNRIASNLSECWHPPEA